MIWFAMLVALVLAYLVASTIVQMRAEGFSLSVSILPLYFKPSVERIEDDLFLTVGNVQLCVHNPEIQYKQEMEDAAAQERARDLLDREYGEGWHAGWKAGYEHRRLELAALSGDELTMDELDSLFSDIPTD